MKTMILVFWLSLLKVGAVPYCYNHRTYCVIVAEKRFVYDRFGRVYSYWVVVHRLPAVRRPPPVRIRSNTFFVEAFFAPRYYRQHR